MELILIAAMSDNRVIGHRGSIPWHLPGEQQRFKAVTMGWPMIMGRKTYDSIGRPLPGRENIVVTRNPDFNAPGIVVVHDLEQALEHCRQCDKAFIIGGAQLYEQGLERADTIILTVIPQQVEGDTFFPAFSAQEFVEVSAEKVAGPRPYTIKTYQRCR